ncbi:ROK family transcriptional regulator [Nocardiopsis baichengensis]|uniref:ROK family transcriptional regulator n=1 Tax=Nocardiopsis baichengensis TaxID=280240 RepID=UPI000348F76E|nr:ROK family transcriptional regulator [Nocardiopsis baichengensis]
MSDVQATPGSQAALRRANRDRVTAALRESGTLTQAEIARATGLSAASVSNIVRDLRAVGAVSVRQTHSNGRRARAVTLRRSPGAVVGVDFGQGHITAALGDAEGATLARETIAYDVAADPGRGVRRAVWLVETVLAAARVDLSSVRAVCAAVPGPVDLDTGEVGAITCMPSWAGFRPGAELSDRLGLPATAGNDANLAARAEMAEGAGRGLRHLVYVRLGEGVGAGVVVDGRVFPGAGGTAGEIGHLGLDERGLVCRCGNRGCLETQVGAGYLLEMVPARGAAGAPGTVAELVAAAGAGDPGSRRVVAEAGTALGRALAMLVNAFNPEALLIGGELAEAGEDLMDPMRRSLELGALGSAVQRLTVARGALGAEAVLRGALMTAAASSDATV